MADKKSRDSESGFILRGEPASGDGAASGGLGKLDFSTFVVSLGSSALIHLGVAEDPETGEPPPKNLVLAGQTIDTLEMLAEKTRGNLDPEESKLLEAVLYELRMRYVEAGK
jgi:hypothetical protein